jgi:hypothetical protein
MASRGQAPLLPGPGHPAAKAMSRQTSPIPRSRSAPELSNAGHGSGRLARFDPLLASLPPQKCPNSSAGLEPGGTGQVDRKRGRSTGGRAL